MMVLGHEERNLLGRKVSDSEDRGNEDTDRGGDGQVVRNLAP